MNGVKHGVEIEFSIKGKPTRKTPYVKGKIHGIVISDIYNYNGLRETPYILGVQHGNEIRFQPDGKKLFMIIPWVNGVKHGK